MINRIVRMIIVATKLVVKNPISSMYYRNGKKPLYIKTMFPSQKLNHVKLTNPRASPWGSCFQVLLIIVHHRKLHPL